MNYPINSTVAAVLGLIWGLLIATLAIMLSDGGNGWNSAILYGVVAIVMSPFTAVVWVKQEVISTNIIILALIIALTSNIGLFQTSLNEGLSYFYSSIDYAVPWLLLWVSWQFLLLHIFFNKISRPSIS